MTLLEFGGFLRPFYSDLSPLNSYNLRFCPLNAYNFACRTLTT
jgi:hypothetical protein